MRHCNWVLIAGLVAVFDAACGGQTTPAPPPAAPAELLITNARVYTGDPAAPWATSLAVRAGRIVEASTAARTIDAGGRVVIPGINDAHVHAPDAITTDWIEAPIDSDAASAADIRAALATSAASAPAGAWIHGNLGIEGIDDPLLDLAALDAALPAHPIWLDNFAGHIVILNSAALRALDVRDGAPVPIGGFRAGSRFYEYARFDLLRRRVGALDDATLLASIDAVSGEAAGYGITTLQVMPIQVEHRRLMALLERAPPVVRWRVMRFPFDGVASIDDVRPITADARVSLSGTKYILDGTPIERGAAMEAAYSDRAGWSGRSNFDRAQLVAMLREAIRTGDQLHLHVSGDRSLHDVFAAMHDVADDVTWQRQRLVLEHGDGLGPADLERARALGVMVVQNPAHVMTPEVMQRRFGERMKRWFLFRMIVDAEIPFALGSDGPLNPFLNILFATTRPDFPEQALTRAQALSAYTSGSAFDEHLESVKGRIVPGMLADFAILSADPFAVPDQDLPAIRSVLTVVGGEIVHDTLTQPGT